MKWKKKKIDLGIIKVGEKKIITFKALEPLEISSISSSCGCSTPKKDGNSIVVTYTPGSIPIHLIQQGSYKTTKTITVNYKDGTTDTLSFSALVKNKI